jgi:hypothetical protein
MSDNEENDEYDLESDNSEEEHMLNVYDPEENSKTKFTIVICQLYNSKIYGIPDANSGVEYHFVTEHRFRMLDIKLIDYFIYTCNYSNIDRIDEITPHNIFRNYRNIILTDNIKPEIAECLYLSGGECVAILKTFWIKIIQRKWKNILEERKRIIKLRCQIRSILHREINGKWPQYCLKYPGLKGMLA